MSLRGIATCALALCLVPAAAWSGQPDPVSRDLSQDGYDPAQIEQNGQSVCELSSGLLDGAPQARAQGDEISAYLKRQELVYAAIGFAESYAQKRNAMKTANDMGTPYHCDSFADSDCTATDQLIRSLSKIGPNDNWCAAFVATLSKMVDEQSGGGPANLLHVGSSDNAANYASVAKLLAIFDPAVSITKIGWTGPTPKKRTDAFLSADKLPVPGCMAIYKDLDSPNRMEGHVALVVSADPNGTLNTVEGDTTPIPGSSDRGVFAKIENRPWGAHAILVDPGDKHHLEYQGCVLPWPGDSGIFSGDVCQSGAADEKLKPVESDPFGAGLIDLPGAAGLPSAAGVIR